MRKCLFILTAFMALTACSVKEVRRDCPCYVFFDVTQQHYASAQDSLSYRLYNGSALEVEGGCTIAAADNRTHEDIKVEKGSKLAVCLTGFRENSLFSDRYIVPQGCLCDSLFATRQEVQATGIDAVVTLRDNKQFATMTVDFTMGDEDVYPYYAILICDSCGQYLYDNSPVEGSYYMYGQKTNAAGNEFRFILPRQKMTDGSVLIELRSIEDDELLCGIELSEEIVAKGYNWRQDSLDDIHVTIDYIVSSIKVTVIEWENSLKEEIII